ncbi:MAG: hypothetical protein F6K35_41130, partial [Okeania sp. SIO2H7]|nr:hypothetical protein [Okeania sp. SIO2H7]
VCALFFDTNNNDNQGTVTLAVTDNQKSSCPQTLTVDSHKNCYVLDENYLSSLKEIDRNYIELEPGSYQVKILESSATYWSGSDKQRFKLEPWALIWVKGGKFIPKLTGIEVERSWCSLNGLKDKVILEVKEKTSFTGLFFDSYKEDNKGAITLEINSLNKSDIYCKYQKQELPPKEMQVRFVIALWLFLLLLILFYYLFKSTGLF